MLVTRATHPFAMQKRIRSSFEIKKNMYVFGRGSICGRSFNICWFWFKYVVRYENNLNICCYKLDPDRVKKSRIQQKKVKECQKSPDPDPNHWFKYLFAELKVLLRSTKLFDYV